MVKYLLVIPEGCADHPLGDLGDQTPLAVARTPRLDSLAEEGRLGLVKLASPHETLLTDDITLMTLLGYDPNEHPSGFAPIEAAGMGVYDHGMLPSHAWMIRLSLITAKHGELRNHQPSGVSTAECSRLLNDLDQAMRAIYPETADEWRFLPGRGHRGLLIDHSERSYAEAVMYPAPMMLDRSLTRYRPTGANHALLRELIITSESVFLEHEINQMRIDLGEHPITHIWPWGAGPATAPGFFQPFSQMYNGMRGVMLSKHDLPLGMSRLIGWETIRLQDEGDYAQIVKHVRNALNQFDLVCVHLNSIDRVSHIGDVKAKTALIEDFDHWLIGPLREAVGRYNHWRMLVIPTHLTSSATGRHELDPVPCVIAGYLIDSLVKGRFTEQDAQHADLQVVVGTELMEYFLFGAGVCRRARHE